MYERLRQIYSDQLPPLVLEEGSLRLIHPLSLCRGLSEASCTGDTDTFSQQSMPMLNALSQQSMPLRNTLSQQSMMPLLNALTYKTYFIDNATPLTPDNRIHLTSLLAKHAIRVIGSDGCLHTVPSLLFHHSKKGSLQGGGARPSQQQLQEQWKEFATLCALGREERAMKATIQRCREAEDRRRVIEDKRNECLLRQHEVVV